MRIPTYADDYEDRFSSVGSHLLVPAHLGVAAPGEIAVFFCMGTVLHLHPERPAGGDLPETEVGVCHGRYESSIGFLVGRCAVNQFESVRVEHPDNVILELVADAEVPVLLFIPFLCFLLLD